jgi:probable HAF family extracellular repeat protein
MNKRLGARVASLLALVALPALLGAEEHPATHRHYKAVDLGTFGGPASYIQPTSEFGSPNQINERGTAVGGADTSIPTTPVSNFFVCGGVGGVVPFVNHAFERRDGLVTDLGSLAGADNCSVATSINARGQIAGSSENGVLDPILGVTQIRAVVWNHGEIQDLGTLGGNHSSANNSNDRGQVVGLALNAIDDAFSLFGFFFAGNPVGTQTRAFLWENGQMRDLGTLGGPDAFGGALNDRGQVAGASYTDSTPNPATGIPTVDPFLWRDGHMTDLGTLGGTFGAAGGLNNSGQVIGISNLAGDQAADPFLWERGHLIDLFTETTGGNFITADAINDAGDIAGAADFSSAGGLPFVAALWRTGHAINLGTLSGDCLSEANAINSASQVVGISVGCDSGDPRAFLWEKGSMIDLNTKTPPGFALTLANALAINARGEIGGLGLPAGCSDVDTCSHAFLLIPTEDDHDELSSRPNVSTTESSTSVDRGKPTPEILVALRARLAHRYRAPLGLRPPTQAN